MIKSLLKYLEDRSTKNQLTGCREWNLSSGNHGYGQGFWKGKVELAHRLSWRARKGKAPKIKKVLHSCDNRRCVEFDHLFLGNDLANCLDKLSKNRGGYGPKHSEAIALAIREAGRCSVSDGTARRIFQSKGNNAQLAQRFGTSKDVVQNIRSGRSYKLATKGLNRMSAG